MGQEDPPPAEAGRLELKRDYRALVDLAGGMNEQARGVEFNNLLAKVLRAEGLDPEVSSYGELGEIDVAFRHGPTRFILEAKWRKKKINFGPLAVLAARVRQRQEGTLGIFVSMSGYTQQAITSLKHSGDRPRLILLDRDHVEAMVSGDMPAEELIDAARDEASFKGRFYVPLGELQMPTGGSPADGAKLRPSRAQAAAGTRKAPGTRTPRRSAQTASVVIGAALAVGLLLDFVPGIRDREAARSTPAPTSAPAPAPAPTATPVPFLTAKPAPTGPVATASIFSSGASPTAATSHGSSSATAVPAAFVGQWKGVLTTDLGDGDLDLTLRSVADAHDMIGNSRWKVGTCVVDGDVRLKSVSASTVLSVTSYPSTRNTPSCTQLAFSGTLGIDGEKIWAEFPMVYKGRNLLISGDLRRAAQ